MKITLPDSEQFNHKFVEVNGEQMVLVTPKEMGVKWTNENSIFRSSLWSYPSLEPISLGYKKFTNLGEQPEFEPWNDSEEFTTVTKIDGCCDENTIVYTVNGEKTIREICETKYKGKIKGFCHDTEEEIWVDVLEHSIKTNLNNWYELELEDGKTIKLTGNHKVWLPELQCYRAVEDLNGDEVFLLKK